MSVNDRTNIFTAYLGRDAYRNRVFVEVEKEVIDGRNFQTVDHEPAPRKLVRLSITGWTLRYRTNSWDSGGQIVDALVGMDEFAPGWTEDDVTSLRRIWRQWHLNDMQAGCAHMSYKGLGKGYDARKHLVCPQTGYRYGSAWLVKPVPADVWAEIDRLSKLPRGNVVKGNG